MGWFNMHTASGILDSECAKNLIYLVVWLDIDINENKTKFKTTGTHANNMQNPISWKKETQVTSIRFNLNI